MKTIFQFGINIVQRKKKNLNDAHEKPGVNDTIWVNESIFSSQYYTTLYSLKKYWDYLDDWVIFRWSNLLFSETPVYRVVYFHPSPLTSGRGFIISIDWVAWSYSSMLFLWKEGKREERTTRLGSIGGMPGMGRPLIRWLKRLTSVSAPLSARTTG